jgi:hypothetical protein
MLKGGAESMRKLAVLLILFFVRPTLLWAQEDVLIGRVTADTIGALPEPTTAELVVRMQELKAWISEYEKWENWDTVWLNKSEPGWFHAAGRRPRPVPPIWLAAECATRFDADGLLERACELWKQSSETMAQTSDRRRRGLGLNAQEKPKHTMWWTYVLLDGAWVMTQFGPKSSSSVFAPIGMHVGFPVRGRLEVFLFPGVLLIRVPSYSTKDPEWGPATDIGIGFRMFDFHAPIFDRPATLHFSLAKAWLIGGHRGPVSESVTLAGFSASFKRR